MGLTHVTTTVRNLAGRGKGFEAEFLVDTGAVDSLAPAKALRKVGIKPEGKNVYELADGCRGGSPVPEGAGGGSVNSEAASEPESEGGVPEAFASSFHAESACGCLLR